MFEELRRTLKNIFTFDSDDWTTCKVLAHKSLTEDEVIVSNAGKPDTRLEVVSQAMILSVLPPRCQTSLERMRTERTFQARCTGQAMQARQARQRSYASQPSRSSQWERKEPRSGRNSRFVDNEMGWELFLRMENHGIAMRNKNGHMLIQRNGKRFLKRYDIYEEMADDDDETPEHAIIEAASGVLREVRMENNTPCALRPTAAKPIVAPCEEPTRGLPTPSRAEQCPITLPLGYDDDFCTPFTPKNDSPPTKRVSVFFERRHRRTDAADMTKRNAVDSDNNTTRNQPRNRRVPLILSYLMHKTSPTSSAKFARWPPRYRGLFAGSPDHESRLTVRVRRKSRKSTSTVTRQATSELTLTPTPKQGTLRVKFERECNSLKSWTSNQVAMRRRRKNMKNEVRFEEHRHRLAAPRGHQNV